MDKIEVQNNLIKMLFNTLIFSDEQLNALCGYSNMTFEIFESCLEKCLKNKNFDDFFDIIEIYPQYSEKLGNDFFESIKDDLKELE